MVSNRKCAFEVIFSKLIVRVKILTTEVFWGMLWCKVGIWGFLTFARSFEGHGVLFYFGGTFLTLGVFLRSQSRRGFQSSRLRTQLFKILIAHFDQGAFFLISISLSPSTFYLKSPFQEKWTLYFIKKPTYTPTPFITL